MTRRDQVTALLSAGLRKSTIAQILDVPYSTISSAADRVINGGRARATWRRSKERSRRAAGMKLGRCSHCYGAGHNKRTCPEI